MWKFFVKFRILWLSTISVKMRDVSEFVLDKEFLIKKEK